jgi:hypothetical protein
VNATEFRTLATITALSSTLGTAGFAIDGFPRITDTQITGTRAGDGRAGDVRPLVVAQDSVRSLFDSEDGLFPGHSADISMRVSNPNHVSMTVTSITPATTDARSVTGGTTPDDAPTRTYCADRLTLARSPTFAIDNDPSTRRIAPGAEVTIVLRSAVTLSPDTDNRCQRMRFETRWTVAGQNA